MWGNILSAIVKWAAKNPELVEQGVQALMELAVNELKQAAAAKAKPSES